jgi:hypothetical protein
MKRILLIPPRITLFVSRNQGRALKIALMVLVFITALYTKEYQGDFQVLINSHIGGILYVLFGTLLISLVFSNLRAWQSTLLAFTLTSLLECIQYFRFPFLLELTRSRFFLYLLGNSFNALDFVYYVLGAVIGFMVLLLINHDVSGKK